MPRSPPLECLTPSSNSLINRKTYRLDHMQILSVFKLHQLRALLASSEYPFVAGQTETLPKPRSGHICGFPTTNYSLAFLDAIAEQVSVRAF
jgi:hypothetical protein